MKKRFLVALILLLLLSTYNLQNNFNISSKFLIKKLFIEKNNLVSKEKIEKKLSFLFQTNLFLLRTDKIETALKEIDFIESFKLKRIYPDKIKIEILEKRPIAIIQNKNEKKYYTIKGYVIDYVYLKEFENLPIVFGNSENFTSFYKSLKKINFPIELIDKFYLFESKRWDLITKKKQTIKLPIYNYLESLENFKNLEDKDNFKKYTIFDYRIKDQIILK